MNPQDSERATQQPIANNSGSDTAQLSGPFLHLCFRFFQVGHQTPAHTALAVSSGLVLVLSQIELDGWN